MIGEWVVLGDVNQRRMAARKEGSFESPFQVAYGVLNTRYKSDNAINALSLTASVPHKYD